MKKRIKIKTLKPRVKFIRELSEPMKNPQKIEQTKSLDSEEFLKESSTAALETERATLQPGQSLTPLPRAAQRVEQTPRQNQGEERREEETRTYQTAGGLTSAEIERRNYSTQQQGQAQSAPRINLQPATQSQQQQQNLLRENSLLSN